jgi:uncharacterized protein
LSKSKEKSTVNNYEKAQAGLKEIKEAILGELKQHPGGMSNAEIVLTLGLESDFEGQNRNYLSWSLLGLLIAEGKVTYSGQRQGRRYHANPVM